MENEKTNSDKYKFENYRPIVLLLYLFSLNIYKVTVIMYSHHGTITRSILPKIIKQSKAIFLVNSCQKYTGI